MVVFKNFIVLKLPLLKKDVTNFLLCGGVLTLSS